MIIPGIATFMAITGTSDGDARKYLDKYPDVQVRGLIVHQACRCASTGVLTRMTDRETERRLDVFRGPSRRRSRR